MNIMQLRMTAIFNEWANRYADNPDEFRDILDESGRPVSDYGECATRCFEKIAQEMDTRGILPKPHRGM